MSSINKVFVDSVDSMESALTGYVAQGFVVVHKTATKITLQKKKEFNIMWAVVGFLLCLLPLLIYLIIYATKPAVEVVEVEIEVRK